jgi:microcystin-dependent protein
MKRILLTHCLLLSFLFAFSQTSDKGFSFQGYAIDPDGKSLAGQAITVKFTLSPGTFTEEHNVTTDGFGVFHAIIGNSSVAKKAEFAKLDFTKKATDYTLKVEVKKTSGGTYTTISNEPMHAVPYARHAANGVPVGTVVAYAGDMNNIPEGWKLCDGSSVLKTDYPQLYAVIGDAWGTSGSSFNLPDLRGRFLRGVDQGTSRDPNAAARTAINTGGNAGDAVGSLQGDAYRSHNHGVTDPGHSHGITDPGHNHGIMSASSDSDGGSNDYGNNHARTNYTFSSTTGITINNASTGISINSSGGSETRPVNAGVYYIIKY